MPRVSAPVADRDDSNDPGVVASWYAAAQNGAAASDLRNYWRDGGRNTRNNSEFPDTPMYNYKHMWGTDIPVLNVFQDTYVTNPKKWAMFMFYAIQYFGIAPGEVLYPADGNGFRAINFVAITEKLKAIFSDNPQGRKDFVQYVKDTKPNTAKKIPTRTEVENYKMLRGVGYTMEDVNNIATLGLWYYVRHNLETTGQPFRSPRELPLTNAEVASIDAARVRVAAYPDANSAVKAQVAALNMPHNPLYLLLSTRAKNMFGDDAYSTIIDDLWRNMPQDRLQRHPMAQYVQLRGMFEMLFPEDIRRNFPNISKFALEGMVHTMQLAEFTVRSIPAASQAADVQRQVNDELKQAEDAGQTVLNQARQAGGVFTNVLSVGAGMVLGGVLGGLNAIASAARQRNGAVTLTDQEREIARDAELVGRYILELKGQQQELLRTLQQAQQDLTASQEAGRVSAHQTQDAVNKHNELLQRFNALVLETEAIRTQGHLNYLAANDWQQKYHRVQEMNQLPLDELLGRYETMEEQVNEYKLKVQEAVQTGDLVGAARLREELKALMDSAMFDVLQWTPYVADVAQKGKEARQAKEGIAAYRDYLLKVLADHMESTPNELQQASDQRLRQIAGTLIKEMTEGIGSQRLTVLLRKVRSLSTTDDATLVAQLEELATGDNKPDNADVAWKAIMEEELATRRRLAPKTGAVVAEAEKKRIAELDAEIKKLKERIEKMKETHAEGLENVGKENQKHRDERDALQLKHDAMQLKYHEHLVRNMIKNYATQKKIADKDREIADAKARDALYARYAVVTMAAAVAASLPRQVDAMQHDMRYLSIHDYLEKREEAQKNPFWVPAVQTFDTESYA